MKPIFKRSRHNPILTPDDMPFRAGAVLNPGATRQGGDVVLLIRAELSSGRSDIYYSVHNIRYRLGVEERPDEKLVALYGGQVRLYPLA